MTFKTFITPAELHTHLDDSNLIVVDCRFSLDSGDAGEEAYLQSHIPAAQYAHLDRDLSGPPLSDHGRHPLPSAESLCRLFSRLGIHPHSQVVVYDTVNGIFAARLWWMLRYMGHDAVAILEGGWQAWQAASYPTQSGRQTNKPTTFTGLARRDRRVLLADATAQPLLIDSRDEPRFRGEDGGRDPKAGHIPGAVSYHFARNLSADGQLHDKATLQAGFEALLETTGAAEATFYCGSGVTACFNIVAMLHAGFAEPKLYVGSWSEWSRTDNPIETTLNK